MQPVIVFFCFMLAQISPVLAQSAPVNKPDIKVGDRWMYRVVNMYNNEATSEFEQIITEVNGDEIKLDQKTFSSNAGDNVGSVARRKADRATWTFPDSRIFEGSFVFLAFPLEVGKTWKNEYQRRRNDSGTTAFSSPVKVEGWEEVEVPSGKFKALKVAHSGFYSTKILSGAWNGRSAQTVWYSPEVKKFVKLEFDDSDKGGNKTRTELIEYEVK